MKITRRQLRGSPLLPMCRKTRIDRWLLERDVCYCYCFGRYDASNDEPLEVCKNCMAWNQYGDGEAVEKRIKEIKKGAK